MEHIQPFTFERVFAPTRDEAAGGAGDLHLQLRLLQAQVDAAEQLLDDRLAQARADGFAAGLVQARSETTAATCAAGESIARQLDILSQRFEETGALMNGAATEVALAAAEVLAARALASDPVSAIDAAIGRVLAQVGPRQTLTVAVHPSLVAPLEELVATRRGAEPNGLMLAIHGDPQMPPGDARIGWEQGGLALDAAERHRAVRVELGLLLPE